MPPSILRASLLAALVTSAPVVTPASVNNDQVQSQHIREADGTSGQSTNFGSGVKTNHIQDGAVTAQKLGITCQDGFYLQYTMFGGWTCSAGTPGPVGPVGPVGPQGPAGTAPRYSNLIVVAKSGGDFTNPAEALRAITDASETNRYLVKIMPGDYDIGETIIEAKSYVDIEGSGPNATRIRSTTPGWWFTIRYYFVNNTQLRDLTVEVRGAAPEGQCGDSGAAVVIFNSSPTLVNVNLRAVGVSGGMGLTFYGNSDATLRDVDISVNWPALPCANTSIGIRADGGGGKLIYNGGTVLVGGANSSVAYAYPGDFTFINVDGSSDTVGLRISGYEGATSTVTLHNSRIKGGESAVWDFGNASNKVFASGTQFDGPVVNDTGGIHKFVGCFDGAFNPL